MRQVIRVLCLSGILCFICIGGAIQTYAFIDETPGLGEPMLYDMLQSLNWIVLAAPVHLLGRALRLRWLLHYLPDVGAGIRLPVFRWR